MALSTDEENAKIALRQLNRQTELDVPASDVGELETYVAEAYDRLKDRASPQFDPRTYATSLAQKAARAYAKMEYSGLQRFEEQYERAQSRWSDQAATEYHRDDLDTNEYETPASRRRREVHRASTDPDDPFRA